jgi:signal transduction histidine kinase
MRLRQSKKVGFKMKSSLPRSSYTSQLWRSRWRARIAFVVIVAFLVLQLGWWLVFQKNYIEQAMLQTTVTWTREAQALQMLLDRTPAEERAKLRESLQLEYPHLDLNASLVQVNLENADAYRHKQMAYLRMFAFEGPFFVLVILGGLAVIAFSLRSERELKRRQENFLMAATHEFRTPITTLRLLIETSMYRELNREKQLEYLSRMELELRRLQDSSERVLATARLEQGIHPKEIGMSDLNVVVSTQIQALQTALEARGASIKLELANTVLPVAIDASAFGIVLSNLLDNAVKYSQDDEKPIAIKLGTIQNQAFVSIQDQGVGIDPKEVPNIFDQFYRVGSELTRASRGLGLGLYLVKSITELMDGRVSCEPLAQGTRFTVRFPMQAKPAPAKILRRSL